MASLGRKARISGRRAPRRGGRRLSLARDPGRWLKATAGIVLGVLLLLSLVTYTASRGNLLGAPGRLIAWPFLASLGFGAFALYGLMAYWGLSSLFGREPPHPLLNATGIALVTLATAALCAGILDPASYRGGGLYGPGGRTGGRISSLVGTIGGNPVLILLCGAGLASGLVLATDRLVLAVARDCSAVGEQLATGVADSVPRLAGRIRSAGRRVGGLISLFTGGTPRSPGEVSIPILDLERPPPPPRTAPAEERTEAEEADAAEETQGGLFGPLDPPSSGPSRSKRTARARGKKVESDGKEYRFPPPRLLDPVRSHSPVEQESMIKENARILDETLRDFKVDAEVVAHRHGPVVTLFELDLAAGVKVNRIHNLSEDLAVALKAPAVRVVSPLPGKSTIGVEVPNPIRDDVRLRTLIGSDTFEREQGAIPILLGTDVAGNPLIEDLTTMPHLLIAGATGSGKSVCINAILCSVLLTRTPDQVRLILIDPKQVELAFFDRVPHLMSPVVRDMKRALSVLEWLVDEMEQRYSLFHTMEVRNILSYNELGPERIQRRKDELGIGEVEEKAGIGIPETLPHIVLVVDELADLMMVAGKEIENLVTRLAQKSRAVGLHIVLATQRPSTDVITGLIKANMPCRVSFQVASKVDSRVVLDRNGAEKLLGRGDMLYLPPRTSYLVRSQGTFVSDGEVKRIVKFLSNRIEQEFSESLAKAQEGQVLRDEDKDPLYDEAVRVILSEQRGSASLLQRALGVGYTRGSRIMDQMHKEGIVGPYRGSKAREVLLTLEDWEKQLDARRSAG